MEKILNSLAKWMRIDDKFEQTHWIYFIILCD